MKARGGEHAAAGSGERSPDRTANSYRRQFETSVIATWLEDLSGLIALLDELRAEGLDHPETLRASNDPRAQALAGSVTITDANPAALMLFAAEDVEQLQKLICTAFEGALNDVFVDELTAIWNGEDKFTSQTGFQALDGRWIHALISMPIPRAPEDLVSVPVTIVDISGHEQPVAQTQILASQTELLLTTMQEGVFGLDRQGKVAFVNDAAANCLGWDKEDLLGQAQHPLVHHSRADGSHYPPSECPVCKTMQSGKGRRVEGEVFWHKDGSSLPVVYSVNPLLDNGEVSGCVMVFHDASQEFEVIESRERAKRMVESSSDSMALIDQEFRVVLANTRYAGDFGLTPETIEGKSVLQFTGKDQFEKIFEPKAKKALAGETVQFDYKKVGEDGLEQYVDIRYNPFRVGGEVKGYVVAVRNVTDLYTALAQLEASEARYRRLLEHAPIGILEIDRNGLVTTFNKASRELLGQQFHDGDEIAFISLVSNADRGSVNLILDRSFCGEVQEFEFEGTDALVPKTFSANLIPILEGDNEASSLVGIFQNVTERREAERMLLESEERFAQAFHNNPCGMQLHELKTGRRIMVNDRLCEILGIDRDELMDMPFNEPFGDAEFLNGFKEKLLDIGSIENLAITSRNKRGETQNLLANSGLVNDLVITSLIDVTEQKLAEEKFIKAFHSHPTPMQILNIDTGQRVDVNPSCIRLWGTEPRGADQRSFHEQGRWKDPVKREAIIKELIESRQIRDCPIEILDDQGNVMNLRVSAAMLDSGYSSLAVVSYIDETERVKLDNARQEMESRWRTLINTLPDPVWLKNTEGHYLACNEKYEEQIGHKAAEIMGRSDAEFEPRHISQQVLKIERRVVEQKRAITFETSPKRGADGAKQWLEVVKTPVLSGEDEVIGILSVARDVTDRKKHAQALELQADRATAISELHRLSDHHSQDEGFLVESLRVCSRLTRSRSSFCFVQKDQDAESHFAFSAQCHGARKGEASHPDLDLEASEASGFWSQILGKTETIALKGGDLIRTEVGSLPGFEPIESLASIPFETGNGPRVTIVMTNREGGYELSELESVDALGRELLNLLVLRDAERNARYYSDLLGRSSNEILFFDSNTFYITDCNQSAKDNRGYSGDEMKGLTAWDLMPTIDQEQFLEKIGGLLSGIESATEFEADMSRRDGSVYPVDIQLELNPDAKESVLAFVRDKSQRKEIEQTVQRLAQVVEQTHSLVVITDLDVNIEWVNEAFEQATGFSADEIIGQNPKILKSGNTPKQTFVAMWDKLIAGETWSGELFNRKKSGEEWVQRVSVSPLRSATGAVTHYLAVGEDITESKILEKELSLYREHLEELVEERTSQLQESQRTAEYSEKRFKESAEIARLGHWEFDRRNGHFLMVSDVYAGLYGFTAKQFLERFASLPKEYSMIHPDDINRVRAAWSEENFGEVEFRIIDRKGKLKYLKEHFTSVRDDNGKYLLSRGTTQDVTTIKEAEKALTEAKEAAELASQAKADFLANMSHEIRTPMNAIVGLTHLLMQTQLNENQVSRLNKIESSTRHLLTIVNDILDLSKIEAGKLELEQRQFNSHELLEQVSSLIREEALQKKISLSVDLETLPEHLVGDETRLRQSLINFAGNAIKFTQEGSITIRGGLLETNGDQHHVKFEVEDTGSGISEEKLHSIFESFEQADRSTTREYGGTGLGLTITRRLVALMGGEYGVESNEGRGSVFWFSVWLQSVPGDQLTSVSDSSTIDPKQELRSHYAASKVLLVEDNAINQEVAEELLKSAGLMVEIASDGLQAIAMATQKRFDLVLMDIQMPKLDGIEATRRLRRDNVRARGGNHLPILAMTANIFVDDRRACISAGMDDFVAKPVQPENLFETLIKWLSKTGKSVTEEAPKVSKTGQNAFGNEGPESVLNDIPGLDPAVGLRNLSGDLVGFQRLLRQLADSYSEELETLQADLANRSFETAQQTAHSLKGAAGTLGLVDIQSVAHELESSCRNLEPGDDAEISLEHARGLAHELSRLRKALDALDGKTKPTKDKGRSSPINPAMLARVFADDDEGRNHLLRVFLTQSRKAATVLGAALVHKDVQAISEQAHKLKSAARSVGADRLADCSVAIESATTGPDWEMLRALLEKFDRLVQEIEDHME